MLDLVELLLYVVVGKGLNFCRELNTAPLANYIRATEKGAEAVIY